MYKPIVCFHMHMPHRSKRYLSAHACNIREYISIHVVCFPNLFSLYNTFIVGKNNSQSNLIGICN